MILVLSFSNIIADALSMAPQQLGPGRVDARVVEDGELSLDFFGEQKTPGKRCIYCTSCLSAAGVDMLFVFGAMLLLGYVVVYFLHLSSKVLF